MHMENAQFSNPWANLKFWITQTQTLTWIAWQLSNWQWFALKIPFLHPLHVYTWPRQVWAQESESQSKGEIYIFKNDLIYTLYSESQKAELVKTTVKSKAKSLTETLGNIICKYSNDVRALFQSKRVALWTLGRFIESLSPSPWLDLFQRMLCSSVGFRPVYRELVGRDLD